MTIEPVSNRPREISVTEALEPAYERVKLILFKPFDLTKWIIIGFCAWLAGFGESGGGGGFNGFNHGGNHINGGGGGEQLRHFYHEAREYVLVNLYWIVPVGVVVAVVLVTIWLLVLWLSSRGKFMFLHCVALNQAEVELPWRKHAGAANSLFRFRIVLTLIGLVLLVPLLGFIAIVIGRMVLQGEANVVGVMSALGLFLLFLLLVLVFALIHKFMVDFVVPILFLRGGTCLSAWRELSRLLAAHPGSFTLYILFQFVLAMAIGVIVLLAILATCCVLGCVMLIPFIGTVLLLPVLVFRRAYPLYYLAQFGPEFNVFPASAPPTAAITTLLPLEPPPAEPTN